MTEYIAKEQALEAVKGKMWPGEIEAAIKTIPAANVVEVVRCKDCKHSNQYGGGCWYCEKYEGLFSAVNPNDYCSYGWDGDQQ